MQFHDYRTHYQVMKSFPTAKSRAISKATPQEFMDEQLETLNRHSMELTGEPIHLVDPFTPALLEIETRWHGLQRPYYNVWPSIIPALTKLKMDADCSFFTLPLNTLLLRFPVADNPLTFEDKGTQWSIRTVLAGNVKLFTGENEGKGVRWDRDEQPPPHVRGIAIWMDIHEPIGEAGEYSHMPGSVTGQLHKLLYKHLVCEPGKSIEWCFDHINAHESASVGVTYPDWIVHDVARLVCTLCLMAEDKELVEPIVLKADEEKWDKSHDPALVDKAKRRGNYGFNVGRDIEVAPHVRAACPAALYWTGKGRKIPRIRFRRGSVVHRKRLASVPTGFFDKE
jgi:hypothetical protein